MPRFHWGDERLFVELVASSAPFSFKMDEFARQLPSVSRAWSWLRRGRYVPTTRFLSMALSSYLTFRSLPPPPLSLARTRFLSSVNNVRPYFPTFPLLCLWAISGSLPDLGARDHPELCTGHGYHVVGRCTCYMPSLTHKCKSHASHWRNVDTRASPCSPAEPCG